MNDQSISPESAASLAFAQANLEAFLTSLTALSEKHGISIGGCGCCDSPNLSAMTDQEKGGQYGVDGAAFAAQVGESPHIFLPGNLKWSK